MDRIRAELLTDHQTAFGPAIGVLEAGDIGDDLTVAGQSLVKELKAVSRRPDVGTFARDRDAAAGTRGGRASHSNGSDGCRDPLGLGGRFGHPARQNDQRRRDAERPRLSLLEHTPLPGPHGAGLKDESLWINAKRPRAPAAAVIRPGTTVARGRGVTAASGSLRPCGYRPCLKEPEAAVANRNGRATAGM